MNEITTPAELDALPVGSVVLDLGPGRREKDAPVICCKAADGGWHITGTPSDRRWASLEIIRDAASNVLICAHRPDQLQPVKPSRWDVARALYRAEGRADVWWEMDSPRFYHLADAVLALLPGRSEAEMKEEGAVQALIAAADDCEHEEWANWIRVRAWRKEVGRCAPTEDEVEKAVLSVRYADEFRQAQAITRAVRALYAGRPTVREANAEGWSKGYTAGWEDCRDAQDQKLSKGCRPNPYRSEADRG